MWKSSEPCETIKTGEPSDSLVVRLAKLVKPVNNNMVNQVNLVKTVKLVIKANQLNLLQQVNIMKPLSLVYLVIIAIVFLIEILNNAQVKSERLQWGSLMDHIDVFDKD